MKARLRIDRWLDAPQPVLRIELVRIFVPLILLGFLSSRLMHADYWLTPVGFVVPHLGPGDWRQPLYLPPIPPWAAWSVAAATALFCLAVSAGVRPRLFSGGLALLLVYLALADRLETFTVSKLAPVLMLALMLSPCGARYGLDAWRRHRRTPGQALPSTMPCPTMRFYQLLLVVLYSASGIAKLRGDWLDHAVLWSQVHDSYQTEVSYFFVRTFPVWLWRALQWATLVFEVGAPLWFTLRRTRTVALCVGLGMHAVIGLMFGPVIWFALLMSTLLIACFAPLKKRAHELSRADRTVGKIVRVVR